MAGYVAERLSDRVKAYLHDQRVLPPAFLFILRLWPSAADAPGLKLPLNRKLKPGPPPLWALGDMVLQWAGQSRAHGTSWHQSRASGKTLVICVPPRIETGCEHIRAAEIANARERSNAGLPDRDDGREVYGSLSSPDAGKGCARNSRPEDCAHHFIADRFRRPSNVYTPHHYGPLRPNNDFPAFTLAPLSPRRFRIWDAPLAQIGPEAMLLGRRVTWAKDLGAYDRSTLPRMGRRRPTSQLADGPFSMTSDRIMYLRNYLTHLATRDIGRPCP